MTSRKAASAGAFSVLLTIAVLSGALAQTSKWEALGPFAGDTRALATDPQNPDTVFAGTNGEQSNNSAGAAGAVDVSLDISSSQGFTINAGLNGNWWNGLDRNGEGFQIEVSAGAVTAAWSSLPRSTPMTPMGKQIFLVAVGTVERGHRRSRCVHHKRRIVG